MSLEAILADPAWAAGTSVTVEEALFLHALVAMSLSHVPDATIVESGTSRGLSALFLAAGLPPAGGGHVHTFDPVDFGARALWARHGYGERITYHQAPSTQPPDVLRDVVCCFFDAGDGPGDEAGGTGEHTESYVRQEWAVWRERLLPGGLAIWHDATPSSGVTRAVRHICATEPLRALWLPSGNSLVVARWHHDALFSEVHVRFTRASELRAAAERERWAGNEAMAQRHEAAAAAVERGDAG